ncbi:MAG TPA: hypothetical protein DCO83_00040 [Mucilaginibacter sp.]|jgi:hypothetical protein|nr:hypothetical protein [Mucilaginibacter sp.]
MNKIHIFELRSKTMTSKRISDQINTIRVAAEKASVSSEIALVFLRSAGIIPEANQVTVTGHKISATPA